MSYFLDAVGARQCTIINDGWSDDTDLPNGDDTVVEDGTQSRAYRAEDTDGSYHSTFLPQWGVTDWTMNVYLSAPGNFNPSGFTNYRVWGLNDASYLNSPMYICSNASTSLRLDIATAPSTLQFTLAKGLNTIRVESSDTSTGVAQQFLNGRSVAAEAAHSKTGMAITPTTTMMQFGGKYSTNDYGIIGGVKVAKLWITHEYLSHQKIRDLAIELGVFQ